MENCSCRCTYVSVSTDSGLGSAGRFSLGVSEVSGVWSAEYTLSTTNETESYTVGYVPTHEAHGTRVVFPIDGTPVENVDDRVANALSGLELQA